MEFEAKVIECFLVVYGYGFGTCKAQVVHLFLKIDINQLDLNVDIEGEDQPCIDAPIEHKPTITEPATAPSLVVQPTIKVEAEVLSDDFRASISCSLLLVSASNKFVIKDL